MDKILIIDDHSLTRLGIYSVLKDIFPGATIDFAENGFMAEQLLKEKVYNLCTMDINMPGTNSLELLKKIKSISDKTKVLVVSMNNEDVYAISMLKAGADGYVSKEKDFNIIKKAINTISLNKKFVSENTLDILLSNHGNINNHKENPFSSLSNRELEITKLILEGATTKEISSRTELKWSTVSTHKNKIFEKLNINSTIELFELWKLHNMS